MTAAERDALNRLLGWLKCLWYGHDWTCAAKQGVKPTPIQLADPIYGFGDYAKMYCSRCGTISKLSYPRRSRNTSRSRPARTSKRTRR